MFLVSCACGWLFELCDEWPILFLHQHRISRLTWYQRGCAFTLILCGHITVRLLFGVWWWFAESLEIWTPPMNLSESLEDALTRAIFDRQICRLPFITRGNSWNIFLTISAYCNVMSWPALPWGFAFPWMMMISWNWTNLPKMLNKLTVGQICQKWQIRFYTSKFNLRVSPNLPKPENWSCKSTSRACLSSDLGYPFLKAFDWPWRCTFKYKRKKLFVLRPFWASAHGSILASSVLNESGDRRNLNSLTTN